MSVEDRLMEWAGLDPAKVHSIAANLERLLGVADGQVEKLEAIIKQIEAVNVLMQQVRDFGAVVEANLPLAKKTMADVRAQIAAFEAKQRQINQGWR